MKNEGEGEWKEAVRKKIIQRARKGRRDETVREGDGKGEWWEDSGQEIAMEGRQKGRGWRGDLRKGERKEIAHRCQMEESCGVSRFVFQRLVSYFCFFFISIIPDFFFFFVILLCVVFDFTLFIYFYWFISLFDLYVVFRTTYLLFLLLVIRFLLFKPKCNIIINKLNQMCKGEHRRLINKCKKILDAEIKKIIRKNARHVSTLTKQII